MKGTAVLFGILLTAGLALAQPMITTQPLDQTNRVGTTAGLSVTATGTEPLRYQWQRNGANLTGRTDAALVLTNVQLTQAGAYGVVVTNLEGAVTSRLAQLTVVAPPAGFIRSTAPYQRLAVYRGASTSLAASSSGTSPLSFQWLLQGRELLNQTNQTFALAPAQPEDEGDYTVVLSNPWGSVTSAPARLFVTPPAAQFGRSNFLDQTGQRLPYYLLPPDNYDPARAYPLICLLHGKPGDETLFQTYADLGPQAIGAVYASYAQQQKDPAIVVWPTRRSQDSEWTYQYLQQVLSLLDSLLSRFHVDTNRLYIAGMSEGVHAVWDCLGSRPAFFAGAVVLAGWAGDAAPAAIKAIPMWAFCALDDGLVGDTRFLVNLWQRAGGNIIYTEYKTGGHMDGIAMGLCTPVAVDWLLAQRRPQPSTNAPRVTITEPTAAETNLTGGTVLNLSGRADALGQLISQVAWTNFANSARGVATGTNPWGATGIPLRTNRTNIVVAVATTTSWASPAFGGATTFNDALAVVCAPLQMTLRQQGSNLVLHWTGGGPPFCVQRTPDLDAVTWADWLPNSTPPVLVPLEGARRFYRVVGQ